MAETRRELLEADLERLKGERDLLTRDWRRVPLLSVTVVLAAPAYLIWGPTAAFYAVLMVPCLILTALYLLMVRRNENKQLIRETEEQIATMRSREVRREPS